MKESSYFSALYFYDSWTHLHSNSDYCNVQSDLAVKRLSSLWWRMQDYPISEWGLSSVPAAHTHLHTLLRAMPTSQQPINSQNTEQSPTLHSFYNLLHSDECHNPEEKICLFHLNFNSVMMQNRLYFIESNSVWNITRCVFYSFHVCCAVLSC